MKYYIILDNLNNLIGMHATSNFDTQLANTVEVSQGDFNLIQFNVYNYQYINGEIVNLGAKPIIEIPLSIEEQKLTEIAENINLLVELQADTLGGAI